jgi:hypothetical protein
MSKHWIGRLGIVAAVFASLSMGCAEERDPISRVQANALKKSFFVGENLKDSSDDPEFWAQGTLIDVGGYGASQDALFTSTYAQPVSRIKWVIQEDLLVGRATYERIEGADGKGTGPASKDGTVAYMYPITSHFDIKRAYNPSTGESINVVEENTSDRPWYEREFMRVDWSRNLATGAYDYDTLSLLGVYGGVSYEPVSYYVNDPEDGDAPYFDSKTGYFDVTNKAFASPLNIDLSHMGWGIDKFPACYLPNDFMHGTWPAGSCNPVELTIRQSFRRVATNTDFEPADWDGWRFQAYGAFDIERLGYARNYGMSDQKWHRFISRYDLYERSHYYSNPAEMTGHIACYTPETTPIGADPHRDDGDGTEDECEAVTEITGVGGSRCDTFKQRCTLPFRLRTPKVITWYYSDGSHQEYFDPTAEATHEWDVALRSAIRSAEYAECVSTGGSADECAQAHPVYFGQQDDNVAAVKLAHEVDLCRQGKPEGDTSCNSIADAKGDQLGYSDGVKAIAKMPEQLVLCHSPVELGDHPACAPADQRLPAGVTAGQCASLKEKLDNSGYMGMPEADRRTWDTCKAALHVRRGDLRYHQVNVITEPQTPSPWGIYTDSEDPLTGEKIAASINVWSHVNDLFSQKLVDMMRYVAGELKTDDLTEGTNIKDWAQASEAASRGAMAPRLSKGEAQKRIANFAGASVENVKLDSKPLDPAIAAKAKALKQELSAVSASLGAGSTSKPIHDARRKQAQGTEFEAELVTKMMQQYAGVAELPTGMAVEQASILRAANPQFQRDIRNFKENALAQRGACILHEAPAPLGVTGLTDIIQEKFGQFDPSQSLDEQFERAERMRRFIARRAHFAVIAHEMGHSVGLRHNFVSSSDAWSYRPQYWQLRTKNNAVTQQCTSVTQDPESCVGPRYFDPMTEDERKNLIWTWMHSTVMDYAGELTQDFLGLGVYDFAAARMFYGETVAVFQDSTYKAGTQRGTGMLAKMDNFGGIIGIQPQIGGDDIHYSELPKHYDLISNCRAVDQNLFRPSDWNDEANGTWHPVLDGGIVAVDGEFTVCDQPRVDYVPWTSLRHPVGTETSGFYRGGPSVDRLDRVRLPYGFATDSWADLGNASVYRHDNGADVYEIFDFLITQQEVFHIFDNYRRGRADFSVRSAANRTLGRYNEKIRDGAKGLGLYTNIYRDFAYANGYDFQSLWPYIANSFFSNNILASGMTFDHFARTLARPEPGVHYLGSDKVLRSDEDSYANQTFAAVTIPNGATGYLGDIGAGGKVLENRLSDKHGEYDRDYTLNSGAYYDKVYASMLFTESVDNFISSSRTDFLDARYRSVSLADLFPDGYRRMLANNLTGDDFIKGARLVATANGSPQAAPDGFPTQPIGWTTWWAKEPEVCFPANGTTVCSSYDGNGAPFSPLNPANVVPVDPQVGWEQQKFLIAWTLMYLPENQKQNWINMMSLWELGKDANPEFADRIELHHPNGKVFVAKTFGRETIFGKSVQKGIGARILEYANELIAAAYETDAIDHDGDGITDWYKAKINPATGLPIVKFDAAIQSIQPSGAIGANPTCNATTNLGCTCSSNRACGALEDYVTVPTYLRQALAAYGIARPDMQGLY